MSLSRSSGRYMGGAASREHSSRTEPRPDLPASLLKLSGGNPADISCTMLSLGERQLFCSTLASSGAGS